MTGVDGVFYYVYLPSLLLDEDFDFTNNLAKIHGPEKARRIIKPTQTGLAENVFSIGPAILWSPFFLTAHLSVSLLNFLGRDLAADGHHSLYYGFVYVGNSLWGLAGLIFCGLFLKRFFSFSTTLIASLSILTATQLTYYLWSFTTMSHNVSFATVSLFLCVWQARRCHPVTGAAAALMILARWQNVLFLIVMTPDLFRELIALRKDNANLVDTAVPVMRWGKKYFWFGLTLLVGISPQLASWWVLYGQPVTIPQGRGFLDFTDLPILSVLFSAHHGLFTWHPVLLIGLAGLFLSYKKDRVLCLSLLAVLVGQTVLNASVRDWSAGWSFGMRRFVNTLPIFAFGIAFLTEHLGSKGRMILTGIICPLAIWNQLFIFQYMMELIPRGASLTFRELVTDKLRIVTVHEAHRKIRAARTALFEQKWEAARRLSREAYLLSPDSRKIYPVAAVSALKFGDSQRGVPIFRRWLSREPKNILARWGAAQLLVREKKFDLASALFAPENPSDSPELDTIIRARIAQRSPGLLDARYGRLFSTYLRGWGAE